MKHMNRATLAALLFAMSGTAAAIDCTITPAYSILAEGQTIELTADCGAGAENALDTIDWRLNGASVTGSITLNQDVGKPVKFTTPATLGSGTSDTTPYIFTVAGTGDSAVTSTEARVVVKSANPLATVTSGSPGSYGVVNGACGTKNNGSATSMPTGSEQCAAGSTPKLAVTGPNYFSWTCAGTGGGSDASCYAVKGYSIATSMVTSGLTGTFEVSPDSADVAQGGSAQFTASSSNNYSVSFSGCPGSASGNTFNAGPINAACTLVATFSNTPVAGVCGSAHSTTNVLTSAPTANLCGSGTTPSAVSTSTNQYSWTCSGINGSSSTASCSVKRGYTVTASASGANGSVSQQPGNPVAGGTTAVIGLTTTTGYNPVVGSNTCASGTLSGSGTSWTYTTGAVSGDCAVSFTFEQTPTGITCNGITMPGTITEVDTPMSANPMQRATYSPGPDVVYAFKITVPAGAGASVRSINATRTTSSQNAKRVVISQCKGDYATSNKLAGCYGLGTEVSQVKYSIGYSTSVAPLSRYCHLQPGQTYWVNVSSRNDPTGEPTCTSSNGCSFYFESN